jgi:hypothetical protein
MLTGVGIGEEAATGDVPKGNYAFLSEPMAKLAELDRQPRIADESLDPKSPDVLSVAGRISALR